MRANVRKRAAVILVSCERKKHETFRSGSNGKVGYGSKAAGAEVIGTSFIRAETG